MAAVAPRGVVFPVQRSDIEHALEPYVLRRFELGKSAGSLWWARLRALLGRRAKSVPRVRHDYSGVWSQDQLPGAPAVENARYLLRWGEQGIEVRGWAEKRVHLLLLSRALDALRPASVLEVGSGNGLVLMMLATGHAQVRFSGVELTEAGLQAARRMQSQPSLPPAVLNSLPYPASSPEAFRAVEFQQGNAAQLPFADKSVDLAMTSLALEQMNEVRRAAFRELARVARKWVLM
ncbi:MAG TPA: class I SAM-dependent methyltransferase, partial [Burkholderiales bacterium]|nr:class I SAM-dependent methyltransferase [Burkholderiales bacterium]